MSAAKVTIDHDEIQAWVEERGGKPAHVRESGKKGSDLGVLRIDFPGYSGEDTLEPVEWDDWFEAFEANGLAFLHQDETEDGKESRFNKLISRDSEAAMDIANRSAGKSKAKSSGKKS